MSKLKRDIHVQTKELDALNTPITGELEFKAVYGFEYEEAREVLKACFSCSLSTVKGVDEELSRIRNPEFKRALSRYRHKKQTKHLQNIF